MRGSVQESTTCVVSCAPIASEPVWIVAAAPREYLLAKPDLESDDVYLGHDEVIVVFTDQRARRIGLPPAA